MVTRLVSKNALIIMRISDSNSGHYLCNRCSNSIMLRNDYSSHLRKILQNCKSDVKVYVTVHEMAAIVVIS